MLASGSPLSSTLYRLRAHSPTVFETHHASRHGYCIHPTSKTSKILTKNNTIILFSHEYVCWREVPGEGRHGVREGEGLRRGRRGGGGREGGGEGRRRRDEGRERWEGRGEKVGRGKI